MARSLFQTDERMSVASGRIAIVFLTLTQMGLLGSILYRGLVLEQNSGSYADIRIILLLSVFGYIGARLYFSAILPEISLKTLLKIYVGLVVLLFVGLSIWLGFPKLDNWKNTLLPILLGPAIILGLYWAFAHFGKKRLEKNLELE